MRNIKLNTIFIGFILLLVTLFNYKVFSELHSHNVGNNYYIVHAHPVEKDHNNNSPVKTHHHSNTELLILFLISNIELLVIFFMINILFEKLMVYIYRINKNFIPTSFTCKLPALRGPPFC